MDDLAVTPQNALAILEQQDTPEAKAIIDYVTAIRKKDIAVLGADEAFVLQDKDGQIKAFKKALFLSVQDGTLIKPVANGPLVLSAQGYEVWAEGTGATVVFPKQVIVGNEWKPNPYAERDPINGRILAVHAHATAYKFSSMGIPQVSDWTTIFDTPSYRMIDLLAKAKSYPQAFKALPNGMEPENSGNQTWAPYPFDESIKLWVDTSHAEVIKMLSQILNREKKAMDFAQTFAKRNALKHLSGIQKAPFDNWSLPVLAWRPTGNNVVKWDATQYATLQDRVVEMVDGGGSNFTQKPELIQGSERTSEEEGFEALEATIDPEDSPDAEKKPDPQETRQTEKTKDQTPTELSKNVKQAVVLWRTFPDEFGEACKLLNIGASFPVESYSDQTAIKVCQKVGELVDAQN